MTCLPIGWRYAAHKELSEPKLAEPAGARNLRIKLAMSKVEEKSVGGPTGGPSPHSSTHQLTKRMVLELGQGVGFLTVEEFAVEYGTGEPGLTFAWNGEPPYALRHWPKTRGDGVEHRLFLTMPKVVDAQVAGDRHSRLAGVGEPGTTGGNRVAVDLFLGVIEQHIVLTE